jgi:hypothetical protein
MFAGSESSRRMPIRMPEGIERLMTLSNTRAPGEAYRDPTAASTNANAAAGCDSTSSAGRWTTR